LELIPAKLFIKRYIRPKYIHQEDQESLTYKGVIAELPVFPIEKGIAGPGLLAQVMIDKFVDHLPIYRQIQRFKREDINIPSSTINGWQEAVCNLLEPLYENLKHRVLSQGYLQVDETPIRVLDKSKKGKTHRGYHWVYYSPLERMVLFDYRKGRGRDGPKDLLKNFSGYLQTDGYSVYDFFANQKEITHLNCMAHARRGFEKALDYDKIRAEYAMEIFQRLYAIERVAKEQNMSPEQRHVLRLDESLPLLNELGKWIAETYKTVLPKSPIGKAMAYCIPRWDNLMNYLKDGSLEIDNNLAENAIRPIALGRKNYLFAGSTRGAERAAMFYSFFGTCKKNNVNPFEWLRKVLEVIPEHKVNKLHELLPQNLEL
jgi:transposase